MQKSSREVAWLGPSTAPMRASTLEGVYWSSEDLCWGNAKSEVSAESKEMLSRQSKSALSFHERSRGQARCQRLLQTKIKTALAAVLLYIYEPCSSILGIQCNWTRQT